MAQLSGSEAVSAAGLGWWKSCDAKTIALFQLSQKAVETAIGRPVQTPEFVALIAEILTRKDA